MHLSDFFAQEHGAQAKLAKATGIPAPLLSQWASEDRPVPPVRCVEIERATGGAVTRRDLRPKDWREIWPELADAAEQAA
ncbi:DNA-binding transcriptional regulator Cro [Roseateles sp. YR242]|uniref:transcriptional regulator n=1 Tax=Roseateles sp. YR242 TaxID=1855305 RepID=UPI0008CEB701|nr:Cro/CI family transcriptional regulator [Roseateles sp. YR242]SEL13142.1 DNA-binding transcriptional regulator Cro [Roseateles sp. YR242]